MLVADTSVWGVRHLLVPAERQTFDRDVVNGDVAICDQIAAELLYTARNQAELRQLRSQLGALPQLPITPAHWQRVLDVLDLLSGLGGAHQRSVKVADCIIAAVAEEAQLEVLHYDGDYDVIARVTRQPVRAVAPIGSL